MSKSRVREHLIKGPLSSSERTSQRVEWEWGGSHFGKARCLLFVELSVISPECLWWIWSWNGSVFEFFGVWWSFEVSQVFYLSLYEQGTCINWFLWLRWTSYDIMCLWSKRKRTGQNASEFSLLYSEQDNHYIGVQQHIGINNSTRVESKKAVRPNGNSLVSEMTGLMDDEHMSATI